MILQNPTLLDSMALIPVVSAVQVLIPLGRVTSHLVRPLEVWLALNPVYNPMDRFLECHIHLPYLRFWFLNPQTPLGPRRETTLSRTIYHWCFTFILDPVILQSFVLFNAPHQLPHVLGRLFSQRLPQFKILGQSHSKSTRCNLLITSVDLIVKLLELANITVKGFSYPHFHG